jgi:hypothetical protein
MELSEPAVTEDETATPLRLAGDRCHRGDEENDQEAYNLEHATLNEGASVNRG